MTPQKQKDLEFIKRFSKIEIKEICEYLGTHTQNIWTGKASEATINKVKEELKRRLEELIKIYGEGGKKL